MNNRKTTLGGAISKAGTTMIGVGLLPQLSGLPPKVATYVALAGFILNIIGGFITAYYAADTTTVRNIADAVDQINQGGTSVFAPPAVEKQANKP
jgi:fructose-specific phosphotransferase system IIC component